MMKKLIYSIAMVAGLTACNGDYDDWSAPQNNPGSETAAKYVIPTENKLRDINFAEAQDDTVQLFSATPAGGSVEKYDVTITNEERTKVQQIEATVDGKVAVADLETAVKQVYGIRPVERTLFYTISTLLEVSSADGVVVAECCSDTLNFKATPNAPVLSEAYYLVGDMLTQKDDEGNTIVNGWAAEGMKQFSHSDKDVYDDPVFTIKFETTAANQYWQVIPQRNIDMGDFWNKDNGVLGVITDGDAAWEGSLVTTNPGAGLIVDPGKYILTIDVLDGTYKLEKQPLELYLTGSKYSWGGTWLPMTPIYGSDVDFWTVIYLDAEEKFKFAPQAAWRNDFGGEATIIDEANSGVVADGTDLKCSQAGWYLLHVVNDAERKVEILAPKVYLIGETAGEWNVNDSHLFNVPATSDGEFVSPEFATDAELRMCVSIAGFDWWKTEFIIADGKIDYRGKGGDQARVNVTAGQKAYLNFTNGTGEIK